MQGIGWNDGIIAWRNLYRAPDGNSVTAEAASA
jgi:hypothetical protein